MSTLEQDMSTDVIDHLAGIIPGSPLDQLRRRELAEELAAAPQPERLAVASGLQRPHVGDRVRRHRDAVALAGRQGARVDVDRQRRPDPATGGQEHVV